MATYRAVEPELFRHPVLRRGGMVARDVYLSLIVCYADDEGRFRYDPEAILDTTFTRRDPVTLEQVQSALGFLCDEGLVLLYGNGEQYGFVTGWFEHQVLSRRDESSLPPPPCDVCSWERVDEIRRDRAKALGHSLQNVRADEALRRYAQDNLASSTSRQRAVDEPSTAGEPDLTGRDMTEGTSTAVPPARGPDLQLIPAEDPHETDAGNNGRDNGDGKRRVRGPALTGNLAAIRKLCKSRNWPTEDMNRFLYTLRDLLGMDETKRALYVGDEDEAAGYVLQALQETYPPPAKLVTHYGRKDIIDDLLRTAEKLSAEDE